jgi:hypothetical protein
MASPVVDYLDVDDITVPGQLFALISVVSPTSNQKTERCGIKIRGVFNTRAEADAHARKLQSLDSRFDIFLVDMYKWLMLPPDLTKIDDQQYQEKELNDLMQGYLQNQVLAKQHFETRKKNVLQDGLDTHLLSHEVLPPPPPPRGDDGEAGPSDT